MAPSFDFRKAINVVNNYLIYLHSQTDGMLS